MTNICSTGCQTVFVKPVWQTRFDNRLSGLTTGCIHDTAVCQTGCQTGLTTGWMFVYTIQPVVKPDWQPVVSCKRGRSGTRRIAGSLAQRREVKTNKKSNSWTIMWALCVYADIVWKRSEVKSATVNYGTTRATYNFGQCIAHFAASCFPDKQNI